MNTVQNHCQVRNIGLALDVVEKWIEKKRIEFPP
jgi:hypothetical protein